MLLLIEITPFYQSLYSKICQVNLLVSNRYLSHSFITTQPVRYSISVRSGFGKTLHLIYPYDFSPAVVSC